MVSAHQVFQAIHDQVPQPAPVTAPNLQTLSTNPHPTDRVTQFISAQARYAKARVDEGRTEFASWKSDGTPRTPPRVAPLVSAFDTPILKPRVPGTELDMHAGSRAGDSVPSASQATRKVDQVRVAKEREERVVEDRDKKREKRKQKGAANEGQDEIKRPATRTLKTVDAAASKKRPKTPTSSEVDHIARLADRRERKRARREIVKPAPIASSSVDKENEVEDDDMEDEGPSALKLKKTTKGGKVKQSKSKKVPAGMALLYGFSAQNVGGNRLTIKPSASPQYGVFNRGRASTKTKVGTKSNLARGALFSEERFLSSTRSRPAGPSAGAGRFRRLADEQASSSHSSSAASAPAIVTRAKPITVRRNGTRRGRSPAASKDDETPVTREQSVAAESAPWDIEDGRSLSSKLPSEPPLKQSTAMMDMRQHRLGKLLEKSAPPAEASGCGGDQLSQSEPRREHTLAPFHDVPSQERVPSRQLTRGTMSSLAPSESASQVLRRAQNAVTGMQLSKYFTQPRKPPVKEIRPASVPVPIDGGPASHPKPPSPLPQTAPALLSNSRSSRSRSLPPRAAVAQHPTIISFDVKRPSSADSFERALKALDAPDPSLRLRSSSRRPRPSRRRSHQIFGADIPHDGYDLDGDAEAHDLPQVALGELPFDVYAVGSEAGTLYAVDEYGRVFVADEFAGDDSGAHHAHEDDLGHEDRPLSAYDALEGEGYLEEGAMINPDGYPSTEYHGDAGNEHWLEEHQQWVVCGEPVDDGYAVDAHTDDAPYDSEDATAHNDYAPDDFAEWSAQGVRSVSHTPGSARLDLRTAYHAEEDVARQLQGHWQPQTY